MNKRSLYLKICALLLCAGLLVSCDGSTLTPASAISPDTTAKTENTDIIDSTGSVEMVSNPVTIDMVKYEESDYYSDWEPQNPNYIQLNGTSASLNGSGAQIDGGIITITSAGIYVISGRLDNGQIIVDSEDKEIVRLILNGMEINCADSAPIYVKKSEKTVITLQDGTQNFLTDGESYILSDTESEEPSAALFSKDDLVINGTGALSVEANYKDGITSKDDLKIMSGNIFVTSADDGLIGRDIISIKDGKIVINSGGDGLKSTNDTDEGKGFILIEAGKFDIVTGADGIQAETSVLIADGDFKITTNGGSANGVAKADGKMGDPWGSKEKVVTLSDDTESSSAKGIKAASDININGGKISIDSSDDAIHSNLNIAIESGDITINSGDDGIHADSSIQIESGNISIAKSYEGIESALVTINGGTINLVASDDGINIAGGNDGSSMNGRPGQNNINLSSNNKLSINGGYVSVEAVGDGLDANGSIYVSSGTVIVNGPTNNGNGPLDYDGVFEITGGTVVAAGSSGMAQAPSDYSTQYSVAMTYSSVQQAGTLVNLQDGNGNTVVTFAPKKQYQIVIISSPEIKKDTSYSIYTGGNSTGSEVNGIYADGEYTGTKLVDFTISKITTWMSESGETSGGGFGHGGMQGPGEGGEREGRPEGGKRRGIQ